MDLLVKRIPRRLLDVRVEQSNDVKESARGMIGLLHESLAASLDSAEERLLFSTGCCLLASFLLRHHKLGRHPRHRKHCGQRVERDRYRASRIDSFTYVIALVEQADSRQ